MGEATMNNKSMELIEQILEVDFGKSIENATANELHEAITKYCMNNVRNLWKAEQGEFVRTAYYMSAEFLVGRQITSNLLNMQILQDVKECLQAKGRDINFAEDISDMALGNGGLGRLAACYLESGASIGKKLDGYGIRYKYGLFEQSFEGGCQKEVCDDWAKFGDPWSERREDESVIVELNGTSVLAVPYDMPIIGYGGKTINTLRLWQAEHTVSHSFEDFNSMNYDNF